MSLVSPGVEVTVVDQSQYLPAPTNSIPFILLATAENKANPTGTGIAQATTAANANKLFRVTSQRDLVTLYGNPFFYTTTDGTPVQGYELNEYGLLAAYSTLGVTNQILVLRADVDLASLVGQSGRPVGEPENGTWWLDTTASTWGIYEFSAITGQFTLQQPIVITDPADLSGSTPISSLGNIGDYAVNAIATTNAPTDAKQFFYKNSNNVWVGIGTPEWLDSIPTIVGTNSNPTVSALETLTVTLATGQVANITGNTTAAQIAADINNLGWGYLSASVNSAGRLQIFSKKSNLLPSPNGSISISGASALLSALGITSGVYYQPMVSYGTSAQQPLWTSSQSAPRPSGSVWIKVGAAGSGLVPSVSEYNSTVSAWLPKVVNYGTSDVTVNASIDATGGQAIPAGAVYAQYNYEGSYNQGPVYLWERIATGPTVVTGNSANVSIGASSNVSVYVSEPGQTSLTSAYTVSLSSGDDATDFVTSWLAAGIPYTTATVSTSGAIQLTHTEGGVVVMDDTLNGVSTGVIEDAGFVIGTTDGVKYGPSVTGSFAVTDVTGNLELNVQTSYGTYNIISVLSGGDANAYTVGDVVSFAGTEFGGSTPANDLDVEITQITANVVTGVTFVSGAAPELYMTQLSNWYEFSYTANEGAPVVAPDNNTNWFYSVVDQVDVMVNYNGAWRGYSNQNYDVNGFPTPSGSNTTDPNGPIVAVTEPTTQSDGTALAYGDIWISTADLENYPIIYRWQQVDAEDQWVLVDNTDQVGSTGILFADARWAPNGSVNPADDPIPTITSLLTSNYLDLDAPESALYPTGMLLFNTRRSGYNVKQYRVNYFNSVNFPDAALPTQRDAWVTASGLQANGSPYMGRKAQRAMVVQSLRAAIDTNTAVRDEDNFFNLLACPNYPELQPNMVVLNADRGETGYILGDTPMRLPDSATAIQAWANNEAGATSTGEEGLVTRNTYLGLFYPSGLASDLSGNLVAVPASHMMLRTFLRNDTIAYPWLAAAGTRRGIIDNATNIGYLDSATGEFVTIRTRIGIRDVLYTNFINPLVFFTGNGLLNYGNKTSFNSQSALDRTNVARLVAYIRRQLTLASRPFVFEPNDSITRQEIAGVIETLMVDLVAKRGLYDYLVVCDLSNNTPARIDRNELWVDVAIEPVKAAEFIYIPVRILNTGELAAL